MMFSRRVVRQSIYLEPVALHISCPHHLVIGTHVDHVDSLKVNSMV